MYTGSKFWYILAIILSMVGILAVNGAIIAHYNHDDSLSSIFQGDAVFAAIFAGTCFLVGSCK